jgi:hypothetical protein
MIVIGGDGTDLIQVQVVLAPAPAAEGIASAVGRDPKQPRTELGAVPKPRQGREGLHEDLLANVLGILATADHTVSDVQHTLVVLGHETIKSHRIAVRGGISEDVSLGSG